MSRGRRMPRLCRVLGALSVALALALLLLATPAAAVHLNPVSAPVTTCWTDGVWGTYVTHVTRGADPQFLFIAGYLVYLDGSFTTPLDGAGYVRANGAATVTLHYFAQGLEFTAIINFYHHLAGGTLHAYYSHSGHAYYDPLPIWPVTCP